jgi:hypothetical protein
MIRTKLFLSEIKNIQSQIGVREDKKGSKNAWGHERVHQLSVCKCTLFSLLGKSSINCILRFVARQRLDKNVSAATNIRTALKAWVACVCGSSSASLSLLGNVSVTSFQRQRRIAEGVVFYWVRVVLKERKLLVPAAQCYMKGQTVKKSVSYPVWRRVRIPPPQSLRFVRGDKREHSARGYNWATLFLGDINTGTWPSRLRETQMRQ